MGRMLGAFDSEELDRPDLNKCPDCGCYFVQDDCPLCGKRCPDEMRAGNRKPVKKSRKKERGSSGRVTFTEWYHSWWFIALMMIFMPIIGLILLFTSPHKRSYKISFVAIAVLISILPTAVMYGRHILGNVFDKPVDTSLSREEYIARCDSVDSEEFYRMADSYSDKFVTLDLVIKERFEDVDAYDSDKYKVHYICTDAESGELEFIIRDCILDGSQNFVAGDVIRVFGEGVGSYSVYDGNYDEHSAPGIFVAYFEALN